jgi:DNA-3-methyladenine glycosylase II
MLGLEINIARFYDISKNDIHLQLLAKSFLGVKPPRFPTIFEALVNSIACQQVTLDLGILLLNRLAENFGVRFEDSKSIWYAFPRPDDLHKTSEEDIKKLGFSYQKARAIIALSQAIMQKKLSFVDMEDVSSKEIINSLLTNRGIGRWSAEYTLLRGFGRLDTFPGDDVGAQNNLKRIFNLETKPGYEEIKKLTSKWQPYAGLVYFHLLLEKLQLKGVI